MRKKRKNFTTLYGMVQFSQTSWQNGTLSDTLDILRYAPMTLSVGTNAVIYYTLPKSIEPGEFIRYTIVAGFRKVSWTGIIGAVNPGKTDNVLETVRSVVSRQSTSSIPTRESRPALTI